MTQRSKAKDYTAVDKLSVVSLELHMQSSWETTRLVFSSIFIVFLNFTFDWATNVYARLSTLLIGTQEVWKKDGMLPFIKEG
jgi:hypothetical protein